MTGKVTIDKGAKPSEQLVAAAASAIEVTDARGRKIVVAKPGILTQFAFVKALGDVPSTYLNMMQPVLFVRSIDGEDILPPKSEAAALAIIQKLDEDGVNAVTATLMKHFAQDPEAAAASEEAVKN